MVNISLLSNLYSNCDPRTILEYWVGHFPQNFSRVMYVYMALYLYICFFSTPAQTCKSKFYTFPCQNGTALLGLQEAPLNELHVSLIAANAHTTRWMQYCSGIGNICIIDLYPIVRKSCENPDIEGGPLRI